MGFTVIPLYGGSLIPRILGHFRPTSDWAGDAQLFAWHRTEVSESEVPVYLGSKSYEFARMIPSYTVEPTLILNTSDRSEVKGGNFPYTSDRSEVNVPPLPLSLDTSDWIRGNHLGSLYTSDRSTLPHLFRGIEGWFVIRISILQRHTVQICTSAFAIARVLLLTFARLPQDICIGYGLFAVWGTSSIMNSWPDTPSASKGASDELGAEWRPKREVIQVKIHYYSVREHERMILTITLTCP